MFDNTKKNGSECFSDEELVSYLYAEIGDADRLKLDSHLARCSSCTDEFAGFSESRFAVYEWQRSAFAALETPEISGPWQQAVSLKISSTETKPRSWFSGLLARPALVFAAVPVLLALGLIAVFYSNLAPKNAVRSASNSQVSTLQASPAASENQPVTHPTEQNVAKVDDSHKIAASTPVIAKDKVVPQFARAIGKRPLQQKLKTEMASTDLAKNSLRGRSPRLGDFEEDEDTSVRLTDLLADADTDR